MQPPAAAPRGARESPLAVGREGEPATPGPVRAREAVQAREGEGTAQDATLRAIIDSASAPIFSVDRAYRYTSFNRAHAEAMAALYGAHIELGRSLLDCMTVPADRAQAQRNLDRALAGESFTEEAFSGELGAREYFGVAHGPIRDGAGEIVGASVFATDLTARRRAEEALRESTARYRRNGAINAARLRLTQFAVTHPLDDLLQETLDAAEELTGSLIGFFHLIDDDQRTITLQSWSTRTKRDFCRAAGQGSHYPLERAGVWTDAVKARAPVVHNDYASLPHRRGMPEGHAAVVRELVVPVFRAGKMTAILGVGNKPTDYDAEDVESVFLLAELAWEIADRKHGEELLRRVNRQLRAISECNQALMRASDEQTILDEVCRIVCERAGYRMAWVGYAEHDEARSIRPVAVAGVDDGYVAQVKASWGEGARGQGPAGDAVRTGKTVALQDLDASPEFAPWRDGARARGYRSGICLPLKGEDGQVFGLLLIYSGETDAFSPEEIQLLEELAGDLAFGIAVLRGRARRNAAEQQITLLSFALDNVREAAFLIDAQGRFRYVNAEACRALGFAKQELLGRSVADVDPDFPIERWPAHWQELRDKRALLFEGRHRARDGRVFPVQVNASYFEFGGEGYNLALARDLTDHNRLEAQLRQAQKMEAIGTLAGGVAHDFNNILTGIIGYGNVIQEALGPEDPLQASIEQILSASERAAQLTRALLAFSRKQVLNPKPLDVNEVVRGIERFLRRIIGEDIELSTELSAAPLVVMADVGQLEQVLMNLATNARDAMPRGGVLSIATRPMDVDAAYVASHGWGAPGAHAVLSVSDTGVGMDEATRQKLFEPFFTTKAAGKGTGLGLSIVYGIVKQHGGGVDVYSEPGKGTSFKIVLPLVAAPVEAPAARPFAAPARGTETLLVAEDDAIVRGMIATVLGANGYRVVEAVDGEDALARWAARRDEIDMLVLDVVMPKRSGRDVYDVVRAERPEIPVLFLSGYTADIIHKKGLFDDGLQFLSKPHSPVVLLAKVRGILDDAQARTKGG